MSSGDALPNVGRSRAHDRLAGGLLGLLIGDALGVPYEFHYPHDIPPVEQIEFQPPPGFRRAHFGVPPGTWSDDGAHALILLDSLLERDGLDLRHFAKGLRRWLHEGFFAVNGSVFDIGIQTSTAINRLVQGIAPEDSGPSSERDNGNGSLMRVLPLVLWHQGSNEELAALAARQSLPTHGHARARLACVQYCLWARAILQDEESPWEIAAVGTRAYAADWNLAGEAEKLLDPANAAAVQGKGYVLDCLWSAKAAFEGTNDYEACVRSAIAFGHDTDTTAAVAGGIAGLRYGAGGIPERWRDALRGDPIYRPLLEKLVARQAVIGDSPAITWEYQQWD